MEYFKSNTLVREELLNHRLLYDLKFSAGKRENHLKIFSSNVDFEGFDLIITDGNSTGKFQIKSNWEFSSKGWYIQRRMLYPKSLILRNFGISSYYGSDTHNGIILIDVSSSSEDSLNVQYYYTDFFVITAIANGLIKRQQRTISSALNTLKKITLTKGELSEEIHLSKNQFVKVANTDALLDFMGFDNILNARFSKRVMDWINYNEQDKNDYYQSIIGEIKDLCSK